MKRNDWLILIATAIFSFLFYQESTGVNVLLFDVSIVGLFAIRNSGLLSNRKWLTAALLLLVSGSAVALRGNFLAFIGHLASFLLIVSRSNAHGQSWIIGMAHVAYAEVVGGIQFIADLERNWSNKRKGKPHKRLRTFFLIAVPLTVAFVFIGLYRESNPIFKNLTDQIDLSFISLRWIAFTMFGFLLLYPAFRGILLKGLDRWESKRTLELTRDNAASGQDNWMSARTEYLSGLLSLGMLNLIILVMVISDIAYLFGGLEMPAGISRSELVHNGVGALIVSIILAIIITIFFFRGRLNFIADAPKIRAMANVWLGLNVLMVLLTVQKNNLYVGDFGFTYKRIGVYVWLFLTLIGLTFTLIKVNLIKTNWYMVRYTTASFIVVLVGASIVNWDRHITQYNLNLAERQGEAPKLDYILTLGDDTIPVILDHADSIPESTWRQDNAVDRLTEKVYQFRKKQRRLSWKSWTHSDHMVLKALDQVETPYRVLFPSQ